MYRDPKHVKTKLTRQKFFIRSREKDGMDICRDNEFIYGEIKWRKKYW